MRSTSPLFSLLFSRLPSVAPRATSPLSAPSARGHRRSSFHRSFCFSPLRCGCAEGACSFPCVPRFFSVLSPLCEVVAPLRLSRRVRSLRARSSPSCSPSRWLPPFPLCRFPSPPLLRWLALVPIAGSRRWAVRGGVVGWRQSGWRHGGRVVCGEAAIGRRECICDCRQSTVSRAPFLVCERFPREHTPCTVAPCPGSLTF